LLRYAVESVLKQSYSDWELLISDNFSEENISEYVISLHDSRVKYSRTNAFLSVTDNWNRCLEQAVGDYIIMLGDDDALMPDYLSTVSTLVEEYEQPDLIFTDAYIFTYPQAILERPESRLRSNCHQFFKRQDIFLLDRTAALFLVRQWMAFEMPAIFNMQFSSHKTVVY